MPSRLSPASIYGSTLSRSRRTNSRRRGCPPRLFGAALSRLSVAFPVLPPGPTRRDALTFTASITGSRQPMDGVSPDSGGRMRKRTEPIEHHLRRTPGISIRTSILTTMSGGDSSTYQYLERYLTSRALSQGAADPNGDGWKDILITPNRTEWR